MARLSRVTSKAVDIREDSDVDDTYSHKQSRSSGPEANGGGTTDAARATKAPSTRRGKQQKMLSVNTRSPTKAKIGAKACVKSIAAAAAAAAVEEEEEEEEDDDDDNDGDDDDTRAPTQPRPRSARQQRQRRQLGHRHTNSLLMPFRAAIDRYDVLTPGRCLGDVENAPLPEQLEEYKYGVGMAGGKRNKEKFKDKDKEEEEKEEKEEEEEEEQEEGGNMNAMKSGEMEKGTAKNVEVAGKHEWRDQGQIESDEDDEEEEEEGGQEETDEFDSLDDFIVGDDEDISYFDDSTLGGSDKDDNSEDEEGLFTRTRSSPRKLFRGLGASATTPKTLLRGSAAGGNNTNTNTITAAAGGGLKGAVAAVNSSLDVNLKAGSHRPPPPPSLFEESSDENELEMSPSLLKKFDLKPPSSIAPSKSRSPKKSTGVDRRGPSDNMEDSQPNPQPSSSEPEKAEMTVSIVTPPSSPSKPRLHSPSKSNKRVPTSPYRPSIDAFWSQDIINEWNDQYSPSKMNTPRSGLHRFHIYPESDDDCDDQGMSEENRSSISPQSSPSRSPIKGSPIKKASAAAAAAATKKALAAKKKEFDEKKVRMAEDFFKTLDDAVTGGEIQRLAAAAGGVKIIWSKTLNTTAGRANWKRETTRQKLPSLPARTQLQLQPQSKQKEASSSLFSPSGHENNRSKPAASTNTNYNNNANSKIPLTPFLLAPIRHHASIELASKVIDSEDRLLNTLAHEYCHLTNFMISNVRNNPHGTSFKQWAAKCEEALAAHPVYGGSGSGGKARVHITTKHSYVIHYKYLWCCVDCGHEYGRHSRSIDVKKSRCGSCKVGGLVQVRPKPRGGSVKKGGVEVNRGAKGIGGMAVEGVTRSMGGVHLDTE
ncbi:hypothetical protein AJ78_07843 [Emergomyces pasteurianus Ep9510]|uniref:SprT-like domain-containing protein n=1 Tax=Emergomyces pasteurianus Ep9510 TaxID=1447872 RepID=A0A1J9Q872_9EURO|nr:hypothetical protein AJ78_07843 [Emergomyces pasteurianus Ep9510]